jgi:fructose-bisphosphate aldolase class I
MLAAGKGLLALDWSTKTITSKFAELGLTSTPELNRLYRQMLLTTQGIENYISGVIFFDETVRQKLDSGFSFPGFLSQKGIVPGIKVDQGGVKFPDSEEELTLGLDGLDTRLEEYSKLGLKFTKWRAVFKITDIYPTKEFMEENLNRLSEFARISQAKNFVPIVEPEISMKGNHTTTRCAEITAQVLIILFEKLVKEGVDLKNVILKTNMILPGQDSPIKAEPLEVAEATIRVMKKSVPQEVPGIVFLSGGQSPDEATMNLNEIVKRKGNVPWDISFSYARALQGEALAAWKGVDANVISAQKVFIERIEKVAKARKGEL